MIYLDNAATTPMDAEVVVEMMPFLEDEFANPSSLYSLAREEHEAVETGRRRVAALLGCSAGEVFFTSGGTESNNWALKSAVLGSNCPRILTTCIEHSSVLEPCRFLQKHRGCAVEYLPVDKFGKLDLSVLQTSLDGGATTLVSIMYGNNEVGTLQDIQKCAALVHEHGALFHTDAVQVVGKMPVNVKELDVDMLSLSAHKFHGPKGIGALYVREGLTLEPLLHGGDQESGHRAGTSNVAAIAGLGKAAELAEEWLKTREAVAFCELPDKLWKRLQTILPDDVERNGHPKHRAPNILSVLFKNVECNSLILMLDEEFNIFASCGSACHAKRVEPSHVLLALGRTPKEANCCARFSMSRETDPKDMARVADVISSVVWRLKDESKMWSI